MSCLALLLGGLIASIPCIAMGSTATGEPPSGGLLIWLDADDVATLDLDDDGRVKRWRNKAADQYHAEMIEECDQPRREKDVINQRAVLHFSGKSALQIAPLRDGGTGLTVFAVFQRRDQDATDQRWQRVVSSWDGRTQNDTKSPSWLLDTNGTGEVMQPRILVSLLDRAQRGAVTIGRNQFHGKEFLQGDLAELLIYDRAFLVDEPIRQVRDYLSAKWGIVEVLSEDWTHVGPIPQPPAHRNQDLPLSDQGNKGQWQPYPEFWDEFESSTLNTERWHDHNPMWYGRAPAPFLPRNVTINDGQLHLTMRHEPDMPPVTFYSNAVYERFSSASVISRHVVRYGYFEIKARAMDSAGSSAWWFASSMRDESGKVSRTEIDVFELGGKAEGHEKKYHMNLHVFETPEDGKKHWNRGGTWKAPYRFADDFHVFGLEWSPDQIKYYVDGALIRRVPNTDWHTPLYMLFDSETMGNWLGLPDERDLPSTFSIEYVRAWKNKDTQILCNNHWVDMNGPDWDSPVTDWLRTLSDEPWYQRAAGQEVLP